MHSWTILLPRIGIVEERLLKTKAKFLKIQELPLLPELRAEVKAAIGKLLNENCTLKPFLSPYTIGPG
jgi:hypothetical protein